MITCPNCGEQVPDAANFCTHCGVNIHEMVSCPKCGKMVMKGTAFCMYCGQNMNGAVPPVEPEKKKKKSGVATFFKWFFAILFLAAAGVAAYYFYNLKETKRLEEEKILREQALQDSIDNALYELELKEEEARIAEEQRIEDLKPFVATLYTCHGPHRDKILRYYTADLRAAYNSWNATEELQGPQALFFEKKWEEGCSTWCLMKNYKHAIVEASSPDETSAVIHTTVSFALYSAYDDQPFIQMQEHKDVLYLKYEAGEWKIDDLVRDGLSIKKAYNSGSLKYGREVC